MRNAQTVTPRPFAAQARRIYRVPVLDTGHAAKVFAAFFGLGSLGETAFYAIGIAQLALILTFVAGLLKTWTYGAILVFHGVSTLSAFSKYLQPFDNLMFFAAWPILAACVALFLLREYDTLTLSRQPVPATA